MITTLTNDLLQEQEALPVCDPKGSAAVISELTAAMEIGGQSETRLGCLTRLTEMQNYIKYATMRHNSLENVEHLPEGMNYHFNEACFRTCALANGIMDHMTVVRRESILDWSSSEHYRLLDNSLSPVITSPDNLLCLLHNSVSEIAQQGRYIETGSCAPGFFFPQMMSIYPFYYRRLECLLSREAELKGYNTRSVGSPSPMFFSMFVLSLLNSIRKVYKAFTHDLKRQTPSYDLGIPRGTSLVIDLMFYGHSRPSGVPSPNTLTQKTKRGINNADFFKVSNALYRRSRSLMPFGFIVRDIDQYTSNTEAAVILGTIAHPGETEYVLGKWFDYHAEPRVSSH